MKRAIVNLSKIARAEIVSRIMADIPKKQTLEEMQKLVDEDILRVSPKEVSALYANLGTRSFLSLVSKNPAVLAGQDHDWNLPSIIILPSYKPSDTCFKKLKSLVAQAEEDYAVRHEMTRRLNGLIDSVRTRKQFVERFPEFEKYAPRVDAAPSYPLVERNLLPDLKKLGWPVKTAAL